MGDREREGDEQQPTAATLDPAEADVPESYIDECPAEASVLARYRVARTLASEKHSEILYAMLLDNVTERGTAEVRRLESLLRSIEVGLARAEHDFSIWRQQQRTVTTTAFDERFRVDELPSAHELTQWCANPTSARGGWQGLACGALTVASIDLVDDPVRGEPTAAKDAVDLFSSMAVMYRPPRPAILRVWRLTVKGSIFTATQVETRRLELTHPGNERELSIRSRDRETLDLEFDAEGALTQVVVSSTSSVIRRAEQLDSALSAAGTAIAAGKDIRDAVSPASLVDQVAERKAARELGLLPTPADPLQKLRDEHEEARLRAQLRLSEQISTSNIVPVVVQFRD